MAISTLEEMKLYTVTLFYFYSLQYEGSLEVTSKVISGIFALANRVRSKPALSEVYIACVLACYS